MSVFTQQFKPLLAGLNKLSSWLLLLAIIWLCWALARLLWLILAPPQAPMLPLAPLQSVAAPKKDYANSFMIFEQPPAKAAPRTPPPNVALKGVMLAVPESNSAAMLDVNGAVKNYRIGEMLQGSNYKLVAVAWNEAIIEDPASMQTVITLTEPMSLDQKQPAKNDPTGIANKRLPVNNNRLDADFAPPPQADTANQLGGQNAGAQSANDDANTAANRPADPQSALTEAVEELKQNPASYLSRMGVMATGEGYQVTDAIPRKLKDRLGLEAGDKVLSVNGQSVGSNPGQDAEVLNEVKQSGQANIEVQRGDQVITIRQQF